MHIFVQTFILCFGRYIDEPICRNFEFKTASGMFNLHFKFYFCSLGLDTGDRQVLEQKYKGSDPPCLLDSSDGRWDWNLKQQIPSGNPTLDKCIKWAPNLILPPIYMLIPRSRLQLLFLFRFVLKGASYNPMDVMNCLMTRRGYKMMGTPQQRTLPNIHNKDDKWDHRRQLKHVLYIDYCQGCIYLPPGQGVTTEEG